MCIGFGEGIAVVIERVRGGDEFLTEVPNPTREIHR
jgi:hypothetical protein